MSDYVYWQNALAGEFGPIHDGDPQPGFYRWRRKGQIDRPVAIWCDDDGTMRAMVGDHDDDAAEIWTFVADKPIAEATYRAVMAGEPWPTIAPSVARPTNSESADPVDILRDQIEACKADLARFVEITSDEQTAAAQSLRARLLELAREADKAREAQKKPHFEAGKAVDAKFQPLVKGAKDAADTVARAMSAWENEKDRRARAERERAEKARREIEEAARKAAEAGMAPPLAAALMEAVATIAPPEPAAAAPIKGAYGRAASVRTVRIARVVDQDRLYEAVKGNSEIRAALQKVAQAIVDGGETVAGVEIETQKKVA